MRVYYCIFIFIFFSFTSNVLGQEPEQEYLFKKKGYSVGTFYTFSNAKYQDFSKIKSNGHYYSANEFRPKLSYMLNFANYSYKSKGWSHFSEARFMYYRDMVDFTKSYFFKDDIFGTSAEWMNMRINLHDVYVGFGHNMSHKIGKSKTLGFDIGLFVDYAFLGTNAKHITYGKKNKPQVTYSYDEDISSDNYIFSLLRSSMRFGVIKLFPITAEKTAFFKLNVEQTFFQTPVKLRLFQTIFNANIGYSF
jgi:hypothetical protein